MIKLSERTLDILKNMGDISSRVVFKAGNRILQKPEDNSMPIMQAIVAETFPCNFQIFNISKLVNLAKMMDEPTITVDPTEVRLNDQNGREAVIRCADMNVLRGTPDYSLDYKMPGCDAEFVVDQNDWKSLQRSSSIVDAPQMAFIGDGTRIKLQTYDVYNPRNRDNFSMEVGESSSKFTMIIDTALLKLLPSDYNVKLSFKGIAEFTTDDVSYWVSANEKSKYA